MVFGNGISFRSAGSATTNNQVPLYINCNNNTGENVIGFQRPKIESTVIASQKQPTNLMTSVGG